MEDPQTAPHVPVQPTQPADPAPAPKAKAPPAWVFLLILVIVALSAGVGFVVSRNPELLALLVSRVRPTPAPQTTVFPGASPTTEQTRSKKAEKLLYLRQSNIYLLTIGSREERAITTDGGGLIQYRQPRFVDDTRISFIRCGQESQDSGAPYYCLLLIRSMDGVKQKEILRRESMPDQNAYHTGGDIELYAWNHAKTQIAYYGSEPVVGDTTTFGLAQLHLLTLSDGSDIVLGTFSLSGGRGGSLDDEVRLEFSPDDTKLLFTNTGLYPGIQTADQGTMFVYNLATKTVIWQKSQAWTTFGRWLTPTTILAKQIPQGGLGQVSKGALVRIDLVQDTVETLIPDFTGSYHVEPLDETSAVFYTMQTPQQTKKGTLFERYNLQTKTRTTLREQLRSLSVIDADTVLVETLSPCYEDPARPEATCGMDMFNGVLPDGISFYAVTSGTLTPLRTGSEYTYIWDIDVR